MKLIQSMQKNSKSSKFEIIGASSSAKGQFMIMSSDLIKKMEKRSLIDIESGYSEDIYGLGNSILFAMGMNKFSLTEFDPIKRYEYSMAFMINL